MEDYCGGGHGFVDEEEEGEEGCEEEGEEGEDGGLGEEAEEGGKEGRGHRQLREGVGVSQRNQDRARRREGGFSVSEATHLRKKAGRIGERRRESRGAYVEGEAEEVGGRKVS